MGVWGEITGGKERGEKREGKKRSGGGEESEEGGVGVCGALEGGEIVREKGRKERKTKRKNERKWRGKWGGEWRGKIEKEK